MGGDGGVIAAKRSYMRGAGTADTTGDAAQGSGVDPALARQEQTKLLQVCYLSEQPLEFTSSIVVCPYGRLYHKEEAVKALIARKEHGKDALGSHIRGLKDLHECRFQLGTDKTPICPITEGAITAGAAFCIVPGNKTVNVISEKAYKMLGEDTIYSDYGPCQQRIRIAPSRIQLQHIQAEMDAERQATKKKKDKKRKKQLEVQGKSTEDTELGMSALVNPSRHHKKKATTPSSENVPISSRTATIGDSTRDSSVYSSLFTKKRDDNRGEDTAADLFART